MIFKDIPILSDLQKAYDSFIQADAKEIENRLFKKYKLLKTDFEALELRFLAPFIKSQANLYSNPFTRTLRDSSLFDINVLDDTLKRAERIYHLFQKVGILVSMGENDPLVDDDNTKQPIFKVLSPLDYWHEKEYWLVSNDDGCILYKGINADNQGIQEVYSSDTPYTQAIYAFDTTKDGYGINAIPNEEYKLPFIPIVEWRNNDTNKAIISSVVTLERSYINQLAWGLYNSDAKLLNQLILKTDMTLDETKKTVANDYGKTTKVVKLGVGDEFGIFETGDISVLIDIMKTYKELIEQMALSKGVDVTAVVRYSQPLSGESKRWDLGYINRIRNDYKQPARIFDKKVFNLLKFNWGIDCGWENIVFPDLDLVNDKRSDAEYASFMRTEGYWTGAEALAYVRKVDVEVAQEFMELNNLIPKVGQIVFDDEKEEEIVDNGIDNENEL